MKKIMLFLLFAPFLMGDYMTNCNGIYHSYYEMVDYNSGNISHYDANEHFQSCDYREGGLDSGVYMIGAKNQYDAHKEMHQKINEAFKRGSFESGGFMDTTLSYGIHFVDKNGNYYDPHNSFHKKVEEAFKKGSFESSQDINGFFNDGVHFVDNKK
jgi:hypothetical protein